MIQPTKQPETQICPNCGQTSSSSNAFCRQCGHILHPLPSDTAEAVNNSPGIQTSNSVVFKPAMNPDQQPTEKTKWIAASIVILAITGILSTVGYLIYRNRTEASARDFISSSSNDFNQTIQDINALSTERSIDEQTMENIDLAVEKYEQEKTKIELWQQDIKAADSHLEAGKGNRMVNPMAGLLDQFYQESDEKSETYRIYIEYSLKTGREMAHFESEMTKVYKSYQAVTDMTDLRGMMIALRDGIDTTNNNLKSIEPPAGLEQAHDLSVALFTDISQGLTDVVGAIDENNEQKINESFNGLVETFSDSDRYEDIEELESFYFDELHKKFDNLRSKADKIRAQFIEYKVQLNAEVKDINIEGW